MTYLVAPQRVEIAPTTPVVFLAGSIEMGKANLWQKEVAKLIHAQNPQIVVANPRRENWDISLKQSVDEPVFNDQVNWELDHLNRADMVVFYFQPGTQSPITLLELGRHLTRPDAARSTIVCCPHGFWRRGNIEVVMDRAGLGLPLDSFEKLTEQIMEFKWDSFSHRVPILSQLHTPSPSSRHLRNYQEAQRTGSTPHAWEKYIPQQLLEVWDDLPDVARNALVIQAQDQADREEWD